MALLSVIRRNDFDGYTDAKLLIQLGAHLTNQEQHDILLVAVRMADAFGLDKARLLITLGAAPL